STLVALFPSQASGFSSAYTATTAGLPKTQAIKDGLALGKEVARQTFANRVDDGSSATVSFSPSNILGRWRPTPPSFAPAVDPQFGQVTPFVIASGSAFRPAAPPAPGTPSYNEALAQVAFLGRSNSTTRTANQTTAARFWSDGAGT